MISAFRPNEFFGDFCKIGFFAHGNSTHESREYLFSPIPVLSICRYKNLNRIYLDERLMPLSYIGAIALRANRHFSRYKK